MYVKFFRVRKIRGGGEVSSALFQNLKKSALNLGKNALTSELMPKRTSTVRIFCEFT